MTQIAKMVSEEGLQIAEKRKVKGKGEKERYANFNAEFQKTARKDNKAFFNDQCKEIEESNRLEKTKDRFKKIRDIKVTFHSKMSTIKGRNRRKLTESEDIKNRWLKHTEEL